MVHKTFYYARVSTREQNLDRQLEAFRALGADDREIITDKESGKNLDRPGYQALKSAMLRSGDTLVVKSLDRLSRSKADIHSELQWFKQNNIHLKVIDLPTTMMDLPPGQEWVFEKAKGKHLGRPVTSLPDNWEEVLALWQAGKITAREAMRRTGMKRTTFYQLVRKSS